MLNNAVCCPKILVNMSQENAGCAAERSAVIVQLCARPGVPHRGGCWGGPCERHQGWGCLTAHWSPLL